MEGAPAVFRQLTFSGESECELFEPNPFKRDVCRACMQKIVAHKRSAVASEEHAKAAIEWLSKKPSLILAAGELYGSAAVCGTRPGALYLGGFKAAMDSQLLSRLGVTHVVTAAQDLGAMWPQWPAAQARNADAGIASLELPWDDAAGQRLERAELARTGAFIAEGRGAGGAVLVHCAQGRSRSTVAVLAYLLGMHCEHGGVGSVEEALAFVRERRLMAQPNPGFMEQLRAHERDRGRRHVDAPPSASPALSDSAQAAFVS